MRKRKRSVNWCIIFALALCGLFALVAEGAEIIIHLRNGDRVTGEFVSETATEVTLKSAALGKLTILVGDILKREHVAAPTSVTDYFVAAAPPTLVPTNKPAPLTVPAKPKLWNSEIQLGLNLRYSTRDQQEALVVAKSSYGKGRFREILDYSFAYGETEGILSSHRMAGASKTEWDITPRVYAFGLAGGSYDEIRRIDRQFEVNPGLGYQWVKRPDFSFKTELGMGYQQQVFADGRDVEAISGRLAGIFTWKIWDKLLADGRAEYFPNVEAADEYRLRFESTVRYPLLKNLSLNLIVIDLYDTQAPAGVENNDLQVRSAVGIKF